MTAIVWLFSTVRLIHCLHMFDFSLLCNDIQDDSVQFVYSCICSQCSVYGCMCLTFLQVECILNQDDPVQFVYFCVCSVHGCNGQLEEPKGGITDMRLHIWGCVHIYLTLKHNLIYVTREWFLAPLYERCSSSNSGLRYIHPIRPIRPIRHIALNVPSCQ